MKPKQYLLDCDDGRQEALTKLVSSNVEHSIWPRYVKCYCFHRKGDVGEVNLLMKIDRFLLKRMRWTMCQKVCLGNIILTFD